MTKNTLIKLGSLGFSGIVAFGTYKFIQKNEKILNFLTGKNKLKFVEKNINDKNVFETSSNYFFQKLENDVSIVENVSTQDNVAENITVKKTSKPIFTTKPVTKKEIKTKNKRLNGREMVRKNGLLLIG